MWAALEGSILLWALVLAGYTALIAQKFRARLTDQLVGWALLTMLVVGIFLCGRMLGPANPFTTVSPVHLDAPGPTPLLPNHHQTRRASWRERGYPYVYISVVGGE